MFRAVGNAHRWDMWVRCVTGQASARQIARRVGVSPTAVSRWLTSGPTPAAVISIAVAYHAPIVEGLTAAGILDATELDGLLSLRLASTDALTVELCNRHTQKTPPHQSR